MARRARAEAIEDLPWLWITSRKLAMTIKTAVDYLKIPNGPPPC
jgi:hypothetical protein